MSSVQFRGRLIKENAEKLMRLGFSKSISEYLSNIDKKRGIYFADILTREFLGKNVTNLKQELEIIDQEELFDYIKSKEEEIQLVSNFVKQSQGQVDLRNFNSFNDAVAAAYEAFSFSDAEPELEFPASVERFLRKIDYDAGLEIGRLALISFAKSTLKGQNIPSEPELLMSFIDENEFISFLFDNENQMYNIADWLNAPQMTQQQGQAFDKVNYIRDQGFEDFESLLAAAFQFHSNLTATGVLLNPNIGKVVKRYPNGYYWIDLETNNSPDEAQAMGHCGKDSRATTLISLRDQKDEPHVTISYNAKNRNVTQVKGKENHRPIPKYMEYVLDFLKDMAKNGELESFKWSYSSDLKPEEIETIFQVNKKAYFKYLKNKTTTSASNLVTVHREGLENHTIMKNNLALKEAVRFQIRRMLDESIFDSISQALKGGRTEKIKVGSIIKLPNGILARIKQVIDDNRAVVVFWDKQAGQESQKEVNIQDLMLREYGEADPNDYPWYCSSCDEPLQWFDVTYEETCQKCGEPVIPNAEAVDYTDMEPEDFPSTTMEGLWDNIHAKRKRGEKPAKPGDEDYPDAKAWKKAQQSESDCYDDEELTMEEWDEANSILEKAKEWEECKPTLEEATYKGRKVKLNKPMRGDVKKFKVYVKNDKGNVVKVNFGQKGVKIKKNNPERRKNFRARHNCDNPGPKWKPKYWSCKAWNIIGPIVIFGMNIPYIT